MSRYDTTPGGRTVHDVVRDIATHLDGWEMPAPDYDHGAHLIGPGGARMWVRLGTYGGETGRLLFTAGTPDGADYSAGDWHGIDSHEMTAGADRDPAAIAREVTRKLIPGTLERHRLIVERIARRTDAASARETLARELGDIMGTRAQEWRGDWQAGIPDGLTYVDGEHTRTTYGDMKPDYDGASVAVSLRGLSADHARELAALIGSWVTR
jgi:hypothetical protein